jgi:hypothetical protein
MRVVGAWGALLLSCASAGCSSDAVDDGGDEAVTVSSPVERANASKHFTVVTPALPPAQLRAARATGALFVPRRSADTGQLVYAADGTPIRSTCGVTFVDRTHAVTAAHCADDVDVPDPTKATLTVELYDVGADVDWTVATALSGTFPAYTHGTIRGIQTTSLSCRVIRRCKFGDYQCPASIKASAPDIEVLECPQGLPADRQAVSVARSDAETRGSVAVYWFHEIYDAPTGAPSANDPAAKDRFAHYTAYDATGTQNFHYFGGGRNQLLPLVSTPFRMVGGSTVERRRLGRQGTVVWTDLFGCHGTSGSGVMQLDGSGRYELLGPVATASSDWGSKRLCTDTALHAAGRKSASYTASEFTRAIVAGL